MTDTTEAGEIIGGVLTSDIPALVRFKASMQSPYDGHWEHLEVEVDGGADDATIDASFRTWGRLQGQGMEMLREAIKAGQDTAMPMPQQNGYRGNTQNGERKGFRADTNVPAAEVVLGFGKHKGRTLGEVVADERDYVEWLAANARDDGMRAAAEAVLHGDNSQTRAPVVNEEESLPF